MELTAQSVLKDVKLVKMVLLVINAHTALLKTLLLNYASALLITSYLKTSIIQLVGPVALKAILPTQFLSHANYAEIIVKTVLILLRALFARTRTLTILLVGLVYAEEILQLLFN